MSTSAWYSDLMKLRGTGFWRSLLREGSGQNAELVVMGNLIVSAIAGLAVLLKTSADLGVSAAAAAGTLVLLGVSAMHRYTAWIPLVLTGLVFGGVLAAFLGSWGTRVHDPVGTYVGAALGFAVGMLITAITYRAILNRRDETV